MIKLDNAARIKKGYFSEETVALIKNLKSDVFDKTYHVSKTSLIRIKNTSDKKKYKNLIDNGYVWIQFKI